MAGKNSANALKRAQSSSKNDPGDEKLLQRMAALVSAHRDMDIAEAMEAVGVAKLVDQRRVRKQFEARREELIGAVESRRSASQSGTRTAALQVAKEERVSAPVAREAPRHGEEAAQSRPRPAGTVPWADAAPGPAADAALALAQPLMPFVSVGLDVFSATVRLQSVLIDAWLQQPGVKLALTQQASAYNAMLGLVARSLPRAG